MLPAIRRATVSTYVCTCVYKCLNVGACARYATYPGP